MKQFTLKALFLFVTLWCATLATGRYWVARGFVDEYQDYWVPQVASLLPILEAETRLNDVPCSVCAGDLYSMFGYEAPYLGVIQFGCVPKTYILDPDGRPFSFTACDKGEIRIRTVFGWSYFEIRRVGDTIKITRG